VTAAPRVPDGLRVYVVGDIHGRLDLLERLHEAITADAATLGAGARGAIVYLGDYVDRGPDSRDVVEMLAGGGPPGLETTFLRGNHEQMMLDFLDAGVGAGMWFRNGGDATAESYGVSPEDDDFGDGAGSPTAARLRAAVPPAHRAFLDSLAFSARYGDYLCVHAGIRPGTPLADQTPRDMLWIREPFLTSQADHGVVVVHGHTIAATPQIRANRIGIDTGAYYSGVLTALVLDGAERRLLQT